MPREHNDIVVKEFKNSKFRRAMQRVPCFWCKADLYQIEVAARAVETIFAQGWPITYRAFVENGRASP
jgi:hypothetical protein